ncbi:gamma-glutamyltransferase [Rhodovarius crocodyli]|uniref:Glutathione hydrolase proenzyme n=1 Tax=Rhodovarius crocodyli TaxID=1979269 RepID=A0A437LX06_9PROT|nr:gamma-glutamyltransferase [Rhodovarius crocodyli]RVT89922.1 gamma-glutamyltransferase [Rhodovarius crocodyli]
MPLPHPRRFPLRRAVVVLGFLFSLPAAAQDTPRAIAAPHPLAAEAGMAILRAGGNAIDAAVAVQAMLTLVEPQSSGIGGGAFLLHFNAATRATTAWDGRETAPAAARGDLFLVNGEPMPFRQAVIGGRSVGVPGVMRMLEAAHRAGGRLPWAQLFAPAIQRAEEGFPVSARLSQAIAEEADALRQDPGLAGLLFNRDRTPLAEGAVLKNPALAATLRAVAEQGADALHRGPIAAEIARVVRGHANPGMMNGDDLAGYAPRRAEALCRPYREYRVCVPPPPSGGLVVLQILALLEHTPLDQLSPTGAEATMLLADAGRLAFADRNRWLADPADLPVPAQGLLEPAYITARAQALDPLRAIAHPRHGNPRFGVPAAPQPPQPEAGTAHLSIIDGEGNAVSMTTTVEGPFGAHISVGGFVLNNELTDFSFRPEIDNLPVANRVAGGKRPRSSMSPTLVFDAEGRLVAVAGSPGGSRIIGYVAQALVAMLDWNLDPAVAASLPHVGPATTQVELEQGSAIAGLAPTLTARGLPVRVTGMPSGLNLLRVRRDGETVRVLGGADPRREGVALVE